MKSIRHVLRFIMIVAAIVMLSFISHGFSENVLFTTELDSDQPLPQPQPARIAPKPEQPPEPVIEEPVPLEQVVRDEGGNLYSPELDWVVQQVGQCTYQNNKIDLTDITNHWAKSSIESLVGKGIVSGYSDHTFKPDSPITRAEFIVILIRSLCVPGLSADFVFGDVPEEAWYYGQVNAAYKLGLVGGVGHGNFEPRTNISRQEVAVILSRLLIKTALVKAADERTQDEVLNHQTDSREVAVWARAGVATMMHHSLMQGTMASTISPKLYATRAEAAALFDRILTLIHEEASNLGRQSDDL